MTTEIPLKQWLLEESERQGIGPTGIFMRMQRGKYPELKLRRVNRRVVFVQINGNDIADVSRRCPTCGQKLP